MNHDPDLRAAAEEAGKLLATSIDKILAGAEKAVKASPDPGKPRLLFPNGVELIYLKFKVGDQIDITIAVAGEKAPMKINPGATIDNSVAPDGRVLSVGP